MSITLEQLSAKMRQGEQVPLRHTAQVALTLSIPSILQQIVVTAMEYIDAAMVPTTWTSTPWSGWRTSSWSARALLSW